MLSSLRIFPTRSWIDRSNVARRQPRSGFTTTEIVVSASVLTALMGIIGPLSFHAARLWKDSRHQQMAIEEVTDQIERLTALPDAEREQAIAEIAPPPWILRAAPEATMTAATIRDSDGSRLVVSLHWNRQNVPSAPVQLVGWMDADIGTDTEVAP